MSSDALHDALIDWINQGESTHSLIMSLLNKLSKEDAVRLICMFLHQEPEWLEANASANEAFAALEKAIKLNDWSGTLQMIVILDTVRMEEVVQLWQTVKAGAFSKTS